MTAYGEDLTAADILGLGLLWPSSAYSFPRPSQRGLGGIH